MRARDGLPPTFAELKRNLKAPAGGLPVVRLAVVADSATQLVVQALRGYAFAVGIHLQVFEADYDQVDLQVLDESSELYRFDPEFVLLWHCAEKALARFQRTPAAAHTAFADEHVAQVGRLVAAIGARGKAQIIYPDLIEYDDSTFGSFGLKVPASWRHQVRKINFGLGELAREHKHLLPFDLSTLSLVLGLDATRDHRLAITTSTVLSLDALPFFAKGVLDIVAAATGRFKKCLILDLDNTVWGGVIGDDGMDGIEVGDLGIGAAFSQLQRWARGLKQRGVILAVSSKNEAANAREPFEKHPDMELRLEDIAVFQANWENKADNIRHIQSILEIGFDSMVFLDDNPVERAQVRQELPEVCVPELPEDPTTWLPFLRRLGLFETTAFTEADDARTLQYQQEATRREVQLGFANEDEFLASLEMNAKVEALTAYNIPRVAQLIVRSNQFNLRTIRHSEEEVRQMAAADDVFALAVSLDDRFGNYGLISVVILKRVERSLFIDTWLMSCRVLKRGVETFVLNEAVEVARRVGADTLIGEYLPTAKNALVKEHYPRLGFEPFDGRWRLEVGAYQPRRSHVKKVSP
jgi:FkbH-like protein